MHIKGTHRSTPWILATLLAIPAAEAAPRQDVVAGFDSLVAAGLPASLSLSAGTTRSRRDTDTGRLAVDTKIDVNVTFPGGIVADTYRGTLDGKPAIITRAGDHLDIALPGEHGIDITGFTDDSDEVEHVVLDDLATTEESRVAAPESLPPAAPPRLPRSITQTEQTRERRLDIHLFVHDDLDGQITTGHIHAGYVAWWLTDMYETVAPFASVDIRYHRAVRDVTDVAYHEARLPNRWATASKRWADEMGMSFEGVHLNKFVLLTASAPRPRPPSLTLSWERENAAVVALGGRYRDVAHELGHMLGATHSDGEVRYEGGWWCESNMYVPSSGLRSNCYTYSAANARRIRAYLIEGPRFDKPSYGGHAMD